MLSVVALRGTHSRTTGLFVLGNEQLFNLGRAAVVRLTETSRFFIFLERKRRKKQKVLEGFQVKNEAQVEVEMPA